MKRIKGCSLLNSVCSVFLIFLFSASTANTAPIAGTQLAYFVGYHSGGNLNATYSIPLYDRPQYHYKSRYKARRISGRNCRKSCVLDRWTGKALSCTFIC